MAETKADLIKQAKELGIEHVNAKNSMAELREAIAAAAPKKHSKEELPVEAHEAKTAKAGKRSEKALKEAEEKLAKVEKKSEEADKEAVHVVKQAPKARSHAERAGKKYREAFAKVDRTKEYTLAEALELAAKTSTTKFDASIEVHVRLNVDPRQADQNLRDSLVLPEGTGKTVRVAVFADVDDVAAAKKAGADVAGGDDFLQQLDKGTINFDVLVATPTMMAKLGKYARVLGPKGLMPNPKSGTVTKDVAKAVKEAKAGRIEFRVDSTGIVHVAVGKVSFGTDKLQNNAKTVFNSLRSAKPASVKGTYVKSIFVTSSMGPSIKVLSSEL
ncbi:50S ribosomal protein L1 [bacterium]|nr:50S ribosomal protein L1 [bacterium]NBX98638.1 50S ribosomal protein L1 [bacterium]NDC94075.1 50S ribosomal protein L1 [bacterium]NDD84584.1 50S ribosomal protein L1 [bacterium]NDG29322.1 50S ribosomal protein L1 [bacterium]